MTETADAIRAEIALLREQVAQRVARLNELRVRDICECGHARYRHGQGCEVSGCHCPYFERTNPADCIGHMWSLPRDGTRECLWCSARETIDGSRARESVSTAGGVHDDSPDQSAASVAPKPGQGIRIPSDSFEAYQIGYERGFQDGRNTAVAADLKQVEQVVELGPMTLRALIAALSALWPRDIRQNEGLVETADKLLAALAHTEEK